MGRRPPGGDEVWPQERQTTHHGSHVQGGGGHISHWSDVPDDMKGLWGKPPTREDLDRITHTIAKRVSRYLERLLALLFVRKGVFCLEEFWRSKMAAAPETKRKYSDEIRELGLERYVLELEVDGLTVVPPEVHGVGIARIDELGQRILEEAKNLTGVDFDLDNGPMGELQFPKNSSRLAKLGGAKEDFQPSQFLIQQLGRIHRMFRDLAINPVAIALIRHMIGKESTRFSSHNSFIKWQGKFGYGPTLGLHCDQGGVPLPWGRTALTANCNWMLTDYSREDGALAYVPGSHLQVMHPMQPQAAKAAVAVEASRGAVAVFHGATWHGAFPKQTPGMRLSIANYYRHVMVTSQEDMQGTFPKKLAEDCDDPELFKTLAGFADKFPYKRQSQPIPKKKK